MCKDLVSAFCPCLSADSVDGIVEGQCLYSVWVAFYEIYNEHVYDLLQLAQTSKTKRRLALRVCEDSTGNSYIRGIVSSLKEANEVFICFNAFFVKVVGVFFFLFFFCFRFKMG